MSTINTFTINGVKAHQVQVQVAKINAAPWIRNSFSSPPKSGALYELHVRVTSALRTLGLAGKSVEVSGMLSASVDLAAAVASAGLQMPADVALIGELSLGGDIRPVRGVLPMVQAAWRAGMREVIVPMACAREASAVEGITVRCAATLAGVVDHFTGGVPLPEEFSPRPIVGTPYEMTMDDVVGMDAVVAQIVDAARSGRSILMIAPPGSGCTMIARRLPGVLPVMTEAEALEATAIHSAAGLLSDHRPVITERPFRAPHHTVSDAGLLGGGQVVRPGEATLATHGVLFLDELQEFRRSTLDALFSAIREGKVAVHGATMPVRPLLVAAAMPCACGGHRGCSCPEETKARYAARLEVLKGRFDVVVDVPPVTREAILRARKAHRAC